MKSKAILVSFVALFALAFALSTVVAADFVALQEVEVNGIDVDLTSPTLAVIGVDVSETIPVAVKFTALDDMDDVKVKVYIEGYKSEISEETSRFHVISGNTYIKRFSIEVPSSMDLDDRDELVNLFVRVSAKGASAVEAEVSLDVQKELYSLNLLSIDTSNVVVSGDEVSLDVVVENNGYDRLDNIYVMASIPELGTSRKVYVGDLASIQDSDDEEINDATSKRIYLTIPRNAAAGTYDLEVEAYNYDTSVKAVTRVVIRNVDTTIIPSSTSKTVAPGEETSFNLVLANPSNRMVVYTITPEGTSGLIVEVTEPLVAVGAGSSRTVEINVRATDSVEEGTHVFAVNANSEEAESKQVTFTVNVEKDGTGTGSTGLGGFTSGKANTTVIITVILVIVFIVLLIILIVLLSRRPAESEEFGETNYY
ncbi:MAG: hypothetical protein ABIH37_03335 [archaeon]